MASYSLTSRLAAKLRDTRGFMLAEQLLSIIFIGLLCIAVTAGIGAAMTAFANVTKSTESQALLNRAVREVSDELAFSRDVVSASGSLSFVSGSAHARVELGNEGTRDPMGIILKGFGISSGDPTSEDDVLLIPSVGDFVPQIEGLAYEETSKLWTFTINIMQKGTTDALATTTMTVARIGN